MPRASSQPRSDAQALRRVIDVNYNRAIEGLRTVEEIFRFVFVDVTFSDRLKSLRHSVRIPLAKDGLLFDCIAQRDSDNDIGKAPDAREDLRIDLSDVICANLSRVKESLRTLEEILKIIDISKTHAVKAIRFRFYTVEKEIVIWLRNQGRLCLPNKK